MATACGVPTLLATATACWASRAPPFRNSQSAASAADFERHPACNAGRLAGIERQVQVPGDEVRGLTRSTSARPVAAAQQVSRRRSTSASMSSLRRLSNCQPAPSEPRAPPQQPDHRAAGAAGDAQTHALEHAPNQVEPTIDVPAGEELLGGPSLQLHLPGVSRSRRGAQVGVSRPRPDGRHSRARSRAPLATRRHRPRRATAPARDDRRMRRDRRRAPRRPFPAGQTRVCSTRSRQSPAPRVCSNSASQSSLSSRDQRCRHAAHGSGCTASAASRPQRALRESDRDRSRPERTSRCCE